MLLCGAANAVDVKERVARLCRVQKDKDEHPYAGPIRSLSQSSWLGCRTYGVMGGNWSLAPWPPSPPIGLLLPAT